MHTSIHIVIHVYTGSERKIRRLLIKMLNHLLVISRDLISFTLNNNLMKQCMHFIFRKEENEKMNMLVTQSCPTLRPCRLLPTRLLCPRVSPGKNTRVVAMPSSGHRKDRTYVSYTSCIGRQVLYH